ncbi:MAG: rhodanese-like domain-containing protein [Desulfobacula sp.]|uniref:rhodanese-like domain-containing protein n=1 Tax=Desulfobacula sp. TaxID=2593537 RepID=UPI0025BF5B3F|nr:rhodanese-like domain-containing protein [Desulfobacula sp.]MCD4721657.1 rhodanese-like domain-containing protein [Desulfobacula sp.]
MKKETPSGSMKGPSSSGRRHFHRKSICEARLEFSQIDSCERIIEACLLTAIGTLGITRGFSGIIHPENPMVKMVSRGLDAGAIVFVENNFKALNQEYFSALQITNYRVHADLRIIETDDKLSLQLNDAGIRILIGWRMGKEISGIIGLGSKIISDTYMDDEINFLLNLTDNMIFALQSVMAQRKMQGLKKDLNEAMDRSVDQALGMEATQKDLDHSLFRLSGFNDIFTELSTLKESTGVVDSFLLVLLGIFGAGGGYIFYFDKAMEKVHMTYRNLEMAQGTEQSLEQAQMGIGNAFASIRALQLEPMQAFILSAQQMDCFKPFLPETAIGLIFKVDETAMGVVGLGERLTQTPYSPGELELFAAFTKNFLVFLRNSKSFEIIQRLNETREKKNIELENTIKALSDSRRYTVTLEKAGERIKTAITKTIAQSKKVSFMDMLLILIAGIVLGLVYNFVSPGGVNVVPKIWLRSPAVHVDIDRARQLFETRQALFFDARPTEFFNQHHIAGANNLPPSLFDFIYMMRYSQLEVDRPIVVYGRNISRRYDEETAFRLLERGHEKVMVFAGGIKAWEKMGMGLEP